MKRLLVILTLAVPALSYAQPAPPPPAAPPAGGPPAPAPMAPAAVPMGAPMMMPPPPQASPVGSTWIGLGATLMFGGKVDESAMGTSGSADLDTAYAFVGTLDYQVSDLISIRLMPQYILNIKAPSDTNSETAYDLRGGLTIGGDVAPQIRVYGVGAIGYSSVSFPSQNGTSIPNGTGPSVTAGIGMAYAVSPTTRFTVEGTYEEAFDNVSTMGVSLDFKPHYLQLGAGVQFLIGR